MSLPTPVTEVVAALIWQQGTFMICQRPAHKKRGLLWEFVGGKVEPGETGEEALIRECREELGVAIAVGSEFMQVLHSYPDMTVRLTLYNAVIREGTLQMLEHNDIRWITPQEIPGYDFCPADVDILQKITEVSAYYPMYMELEWYARSHNLSQTLRALPFAERLHTGQFRSSHSDTKRPYFCHPLQVAAHAVALGLCEDELLAAALLHDVCEDCGVAPEELPVGEQVQHTVRLLTKTYPRKLSAEEKEKALISYFTELSGERHALLIKLLDRCNNISEMAAGFTVARMKAYAEETERLVMPLFEKAQEVCPYDSAVLWLLRYHMTSVLRNCAAVWGSSRDV